MPFGGLLTGGMVAAGLGKSLLIDAPKADRQRKLAAETARYSPWTGMAPQQVEEADPIGSAMQFGTTGAMLGQGIENQRFQKKMQPIWQMQAEKELASGPIPGAGIGPTYGR